MSRPIIATLKALRDRERSIRRRLTIANRELSELGRVRQLAQEATTGLTGAGARASALEWFRTACVQGAPCPLCGSASNQAVSSLAQFSEAMSQHQTEVSVVQTLGAEMADEEAALKVRVQGLQSELEQVLAEKVRFEHVLGPSEKGVIELTLGQIERLIGGIEAVLSSQFPLERMERRRIERRELESKLDHAKSLLSAESFVETVKAHELEVIKHIHFFAYHMGLSHEEDELSFSLDDLRLYFTSAVREQRKKTKLRVGEIGGAINWMGYNVAVHLALHDRFAEAGSQSPVPSLLVLDQFSQVDSSRAEGSGISLTKRVFEILDSFAQMRDVQIIVLGSLDDAAHLSGNEEALVQVDVWPRKGVGLIPKEWNSNQEEDGSD